MFLAATAIAALLRYRHELGAQNVGFLCFALAMLIFAGTPLSLDRNLYAVLPVPMTLALVLRKRKTLSLVLCAASLIILVLDAAAFARFAWVA